MGNLNDFQRFNSRIGAHRTSDSDIELNLVQHHWASQDYAGLILVFTSSQKIILWWFMSVLSAWSVNSLKSHVVTCKSRRIYYEKGKPLINMQFLVLKILYPIIGIFCPCVNSMDRTKICIWTKNLLFA